MLDKYDLATDYKQVGFMNLILEDYNEANKYRKKKNSNKSLLIIYFKKKSYLVNEKETNYIILIKTLWIHI